MRMHRHAAVDPRAMPSSVAAQSAGPTRRRASRLALLSVHDAICTAAAATARRTRASGFAPRRRVSAWRQIQAGGRAHLPCRRAQCARRAAHYAFDTQAVHSPGPKRSGGASAPHARQAPPWRGRRVAPRRARLRWQARRDDILGTPQHAHRARLRPACGRSGVVPPFAPTRGSPTRGSPSGSPTVGRLRGFPRPHAHLHPHLHLMPPMPQARRPGPRPLTRRQTIFAAAAGGSAVVDGGAAAVVAAWRCRGGGRRGRGGAGGRRGGGGRLVCGGAPRRRQLRARRVREIELERWGRETCV